MMLKRMIWKVHETASTGTSACALEQQCAVAFVLYIILVVKLYFLESLYVELPSCHDKTRHFAAIIIATMNNY